MKYGIGCVSNNLHGLGLPADLYLIPQEGSSLFGEFDIMVYCGCLQSTLVGLCCVCADYTAVRGKISFQ